MNSEVNTTETELPVVCVVCDEPATEQLGYKHLCQTICESEECREAAIDSMRTLQDLLERYELVSFEGDEG